MDHTSPPSGTRRHTPDHREKIARGRIEARAVDDYLRALDANQPRRGRRRTPERVRALLAQTQAELAAADGARKLMLLQQLADLEVELHRLETSGIAPDVEDAFVAVAKSYGERHGISYATWRKAGVPATVLERAGITRS